MKNVFATMLLIGASHALAGTIVSQGDTPAIPTASIYGDELNASKVVAWQTGSYGYDNVHIQVVIAGLAKDIGKFGAIFSSTLSTSLGPGATALYLDSGVAFSTSFQTMDLLSGANLSLAPNTTYYLTIGTLRVLWGIDVADPSPVLDAGVSLLGRTETSAIGCNAPDCDYPKLFSYSVPMFSVTGDVVTPEPANGDVALALAGLGVLMRRFWRR
jgi:hypothetical protein